MSSEDTSRHWPAGAVQKGIYVIPELVMYLGKNLIIFLIKHPYTICDIIIAGNYNHVCNSLKKFF